jgi:ribosomal protein S18
MYKTNKKREMPIKYTQKRKKSLTRNSNFFGPVRKLKKCISPQRVRQYPKNRFLGRKRITKAVYRSKISYYSKKWRLHRRSFEKIPTYNTPLLVFRKDYDRRNMAHYIDNYVDHFQRIKNRRFNRLSSSAQRKIKKMVRRHRILALRGFLDTHYYPLRPVSKLEKKDIREHRFRKFYENLKKNQGIGVRERFKSKYPLPTSSRRRGEYQNF